MSNVYLSDIKVISMELYLFNKCTILVRIHRDGNMRVSFDSDTISWLYGREWQSLLLALTLTDLAQVAGHLCFWSGVSNIENYMQNKTLKDLCVPRHSGWDKVFSCLWMLVYLTMMPEAKAMVTVIWTGSELALWWVSWFLQQTTLNGTFLLDSIYSIFIYSYINSLGCDHWFLEVIVSCKMIFPLTILALSIIELFF